MKNKEEKQEKNNVSEEQQQNESVVSDFEQQNNNNNGGWTEHKDGEVIKMEPGDSIKGLLINKSISHKYNDCGIYKIKEDEISVPKIILGSKQLDRIMNEIDVNTEVKIVFEGTQPSDKGNPMKIFKVFTKE
jgi:hypothetical protein